MHEAEQLSLDTAASQAHARTTDPWTSHAAARSISEDELRESQRAVLAAFRTLGPMHHELLCDRYHGYRIPSGWPRQSESGLRTRTKELVDAGYVEDTGDTVLLASRRHSKVWRAVDQEAQHG